MIAAAAPGALLGYLLHDKLYEEVALETPAKAYDLYEEVIVLEPLLSKNLFGGIDWLAGFTSSSKFPSSMFVCPFHTGSIRFDLSA